MAAARTKCSGSMEWDAQADRKGWSRAAFKGQVSQLGGRRTCQEKVESWQSTEMRNKQLHMVWCVVEWR